MFKDYNYTPQEHEWRCFYCGERFIVKSGNPSPPVPAGANRMCKSNPNGGRHMPIKVR
ncbi:MAG: hypothetical protein IJS03_00070 [Eubacterium sp.]|nr:hypothetical protein [Eubacterium sp.]